MNDYYDLLKLMHDNEAIILDEKVIPLTQQQIATTLNYSKMKVNSMFGVLQKEGFVEQKNTGQVRFNGHCGEYNKNNRKTI